MRSRKFLLPAQEPVCVPGGLSAAAPKRVISGRVAALHIKVVLKEAAAEFAQAGAIGGGPGFEARLAMNA